MSQRISYKRFIGFVADSDKMAANDAAASVSGNFENLFYWPCYPELSDIPTHWGTMVRLDPQQRSKLKKAVITDAGISVTFREQEARGPRYPSDYDLFLGENQLRRFNDTRVPAGFVHATGLFRADGSAASQTASTTAQLINQWSSTESMRNCTVDGSGNRLQVDYPGSYFLEARIAFIENGGDFKFRLVKNVEYVTPQFGSTVSPVAGDKSVTGILADDKFGISVEVSTGEFEFQMVNSWLGLSRTE
jgi:hypothetical protein